jgi:heme-degrading monooxygenase HmoA
VPTRYHLAQFNVATMRFPLDHPEMREFVAQLDTINRLADESPGFVWRLQDTSGNSTAMRPMGERVLLTMSVWESIDALHAYTYRSDHRKLFAARKNWSEPTGQRDLVLWWTPAGEIPSVEEAQTRLEQIRLFGPCQGAFDFKHRVPPPA